MITLIDGIYLDQEEKDLIESFEDALDEWKVEFHSEEERKERKEYWRQIAKNTQEKKAITLRLQKRDISAMKVEAAKKGIPYQTLLASVVHQYARGDLVEKK